MEVTETLINPSSNLAAKAQSGYLNKEILLKIFRKIASSADYGWFKACYQHYSGNQKISLTQEALALAFAELAAFDLESITKSHINMLEKEFTHGQVHELVCFICDLVSKNSDRLNQIGQPCAFHNAGSTLLS